MVTAFDLLQGVDELLATPAQWTQHSYARRSNGGITAPGDEEAVCWCLLGALTAVSAVEHPNQTARMAARRALNSACEGSIPYFNDSASDFSQIKTAIARAKELTLAEGA